MSQTKRRYLVITELFLPTKGGTAVWFDEVYRRIGGREIHIVTADVPGSKEYDATHPNTVHRLSLKRHWWLKPESMGMYLKFFFKCLGLVMTHKFDAIHAGRVLPEGLVGWLVARLSGKRIVIYAHGEEITTWRQSGKFKVMVFAYRHADTVIANSDFTRDELIKIGVSEKKIVIISPGVDIERFRPGLEIADLKESIGMEESQKLILSVGRLSRRKGFDQLIKALSELQSEGLDLHYAAIGIGEDEAYLTNLAAELGVADRLHLLGHVPMNDLPRWYNACDVFAMPNREINGDTEGFGMVFLEAAACGKPVIAGQAGGTGAAVIDGETGLRVDGTSLPDVVAALRRYATDEAFAKAMGEAAYRRAGETFSWECVATRTTDLAENDWRQ